MSGQCEVLAKCERMIKLPPHAETGAPRADAKLEKSEYGKYNDFTELLEAEAAAQTKNFLAISFSPSGGGVWGGAALK